MLKRESLSLHEIMKSITNFGTDTKMRGKGKNWMSRWGLRELGAMLDEGLVRSSKLSHHLVVDKMQSWWNDLASHKLRSNL